MFFSLELFTKSPHVLGLFHITTLPEKKGIFVYELQYSKALQRCIDRNLAVVDKMANASLEKKRVACLTVVILMGINRILLLLRK